MTNSRLTDPEVLEWRFPVRVEEFRIRDNSGGTGRWSGGNGVVRRIRFLEAMIASILSGHRRVPPYGMAAASRAEWAATRWNGRTDGLRNWEARPASTFSPAMPS